jgi:D-glycero-alpha-D-manno-heptose 1-phosphate guanylyltransferase
VLVLNGDSMFDIDLSVFHQKYIQSEADCAIALRRVPDGSRYGSIQTDEGQNVISFAEKNGSPVPALINGGVYILNRNIFLEHCPQAPSFSIEKDFFEKVTSRIRLKGFIFDDYFIDIGIPADYVRAQDEFERFGH